MIAGFALVVLGYAVWYWGAHHFCNFDCPPQSASGTGVGGCCNNRVSLLDALGVPSKWGVSKGEPVQLTADQGNNSQQPGGGGGSNPSSPPQQQNPNNNQTPNNVKPNPSPTPNTPLPKAINCPPLNTAAGVQCWLNKVKGASPGGVTPGNPGQSALCFLCCGARLCFFGHCTPCPGCSC